jgi:hypothetical protein
MSTLLALQLSQVADGIRPADRSRARAMALLPVALGSLAALGILSAGLLGAGAIKSWVGSDTSVVTAKPGPTIRFAKVVVLVRPATAEAGLPEIAAQLAIPEQAIDPAFGIVRMLDDPSLRAILVPADIAETLRVKPV